MGLFLLLSLVGIVVWAAVAGLGRRITVLEHALATTDTLDDRLTAIAARVTALEALAARGRVADPTPTAATAPPPAVEPRPVALPPVPFVPTAGDAARTPAASPEPEPIAKPVHNEAAVTTRPMASVTPPAVAVSPVAPPASTAEQIPADVPEPPPADAADTWEVVVGTSWLNKIGVLIFVTGLALLLGYSMTHVGPAGRVLMGLAISAAMLGTGVALERQPPYRAFGLGLVAGGWAGLYVTTFAMHAIPAARIIDHPTVAVLALLAVAAGMVAHSLRYRSEVVTSLAYASAYLPLVITPLTTFSLTASIPLVISLLVVCSRFGWTTLSVLGLVSTYGLLVLRGRVLPGEPLDGATTAPYVLLGVYWLVFEIADLVGLRQRARDHVARAPLFAVNAVGYLGAFVSLIDSGSTAHLVGALAVMAAAYLVSAIVRARLVPGPAIEDDAQAFTTVHAAVAIAAGLTAWAIDLRLAGPRESLTLLIETELLVAAALTLRDRQLRRIATALACLVSVHALGPVVVGGSRLAFTEAMSTWSPVWSLIATTFYLNREWLRRRRVSLDPIEWVFPWVALGLTGLVINDVCADVYRGLAGLGLAYVLTEAGRRTRSEYLWQSRVALAVAAMAVFDVFLGSHQTRAVAWQVLPAAAGLGYLLAWRHRRSPDEATRVEPGTEATAQAATDLDDLVTAAVAASAGTAFVVLLEALVTPVHWVLVAWTLTSLALVGLGSLGRVAVLRWHAYALATLAAAPLVVGLVLGPTVGVGLLRDLKTTALTAIAALFVSGYLGRRVSTNRLERLVAGVVALVGTATLTLFKWRVLPDMFVAPAWAAESAVLVSLGHLRARAGQRWQGYAASLLALGYASYWAAQQIVLAERAGSEPPFVVLALPIGVVLTAFAISILGRTRPAVVEASSTSMELERAGLVALSVFATYFLTALEVAWFGEGTRPFALAVTAASLVGAGLAARAIDLRGLGYALFLASAMAVGAVITAATDLPIVWSAMALATCFIASLLMRGPLHAVTSALAAGTARLEETARVGLAIVATALTTWLLATEVRAPLITMAWGVEGIALLFAGFLARERALRLSGLALLFLCILKLFLYDLRELEALARILSFVALGLVLLGVSWTYTRYKEEIRKLL